MLLQQGYSNRFWPVLLCLLLIFTFSCGSRAKYAGLYKAKEGETQKQFETYIELKENGEGAWRVGDDEDSFSWHVKGKEIRLNTKLGGVLVGKMKNDTLEITLPGGKKIFFKKTD
ncbi:MAG: hypothetical protein JRG97_04185 [Deltaproteobacteria bacterium]|nr:hypothetical protein [Deltaproteobacteria bacterium]MBW2051717.1 hypothetical protein [Deltaproteobacteria bacterium]MBW2140256.1 hypothetical protein [Deltaproteobacteria bacterium]MBW2323335.1 hypothetical protein [Deltaproteobacteria bacterium]